MPRYARITAPNLFYHIFNRSTEKKTIHKDHQDYLEFLKYLKLYSKKFDWIIYCYCLLPNHYHLLVQSKNDPLGLIMKSLQTAYGVYFNRRYKRVSPVYGGRYKSNIIQKDKYFHQVSKYIHHNPVKANLVKKPLDYKYSSYQEYINGFNQATDMNIIDKRAMKMLLGEDFEKGILKYQAFVEEKENKLDYSLKNAIFGNNRFATKMSRLG